MVTAGTGRAAYRGSAWIAGIPRLRLLMHGTTLHGAERVRNADGTPVTGRPEPTTYYNFGGPIGDAIAASRAAQGRLGRVAAVGLGTGSLACHRQDGETWTFFELDPQVVRIARDPTLFRFLSAGGQDMRSCWEMHG